MAERLFTDSDGWRWTVKDVVGGAYVEMTAAPDEIVIREGGQPVTTVIPRRNLLDLINALEEMPADPNSIPCGATFELANGEYVSPCDKPRGHAGSCRGYCLGSRCFWAKGRETEWEEEEAKPTRPTTDGTCNHGGPDDDDGEGIGDDGLNGTSAAHAGQVVS